MARKTNVHAEEGKQELLITREFDLPVALLFKAYVEPELVEQWMGTKVLRLECKTHGGYQFETSDPQGNVVFRAHGTIHTVHPNEKIIRTFEIEDTPFTAQLEFLEFEELTNHTSKLTMHIVFKSVTLRNQLLQMPIVQGLNSAHDRLLTILSKLK